jgi:hypothetical protein
MKPTKLLVRLLVVLSFLSQQATAQNKPFAKVKLKRTPTADSIKMARDSVLERLKGSHKDEGLFTLYQDTLSGSIILYVKKSQLAEPGKASPEFIYQSFSMGGPASLFLNQNMIRETWVFSIRKKFEKLEFSRANTNFYYDPANKLSKAANVDVADAVFFADKIAFKDSAGYYINADGLFLSDKLDRVKPNFPPSVPATAYFNIGQLTPAKSTYRKVRSFPNNTDVVVELAYDNPAPMNEGGLDITDARYVTVKMQHSFLEMPKNDYQPRRDDPRVGYFTQQVNDMTTNHFLNYRDLINRWHLKKKDPSAALSEPVEPIVFWVENTAPAEVQQVVLDAGERWNEAFEKAGFKNAIVMKMMPDTATWDPADIRYNVIRFVSSDLGYAIGPSFVNPRTGQILGADITIDYGSFVRGIIEEDELYTGMTAGSDMKHGTNSSRHWMHCTIAKGLSAQYNMSKTVLEIMDASAGQKDSLNRQFFIELVLHEMGHTLGLNHNMKASQLLSPDELTNKQVTESGVMGSVMDYSATNISLDRNKQAHFFTVRPGPYDLWAIEYGYTPFSAGSEEAGLTKILSRSTDPKLTFGNDADITSFGSGIDPRVMVWDMSNDMVRYGSERFQLVNNLMGKMKERFAQPGQSYQNLVSKYYTLAYQRYAMATALSRYIGGIYVDRSYVGQATDKQPYTPVPADYQKKALQTLGTYLFSPDAFAADAYLYPYLQRQRRGFNFFGAPEDPKPERMVASLQNNVLSYLLFPATMQRINSSSLYGNTYLTADVLKDLSNMLFDEDLRGDVNLYRQNLQTEYVKKLIQVMNGGEYDNASKAAAFRALDLLKEKLEGTGSKGSEQTKAHRAALSFMIAKAQAIK